MEKVAGAREKSSQKGKHLLRKSAKSAGHKEGGSWKMEARSWKLEVGRWEHGVGSSKWEYRSLDWEDEGAKILGESSSRQWKSSRQRVFHLQKSAGHKEGGSWESVMAYIGMMEG